MAVDEHERFIGGSMDKGISLYASAIDVNLSWSSEVFNVTSGLHQGVGPRYGLSPMPGQFSRIVPVSPGTNNFARSEGTAGLGLKYREKLFAIYYSPNLKCYYAVVGLLRDGKLSFDVVYSSYREAALTTYSLPSDTIISGWSPSGYIERPIVGSPTRAFRIGEYLPWPKAVMYRTDFQDYFTGVDANFIASACLNVTGKNVAYQWMLGSVTVIPTATATPNVVFGNTTLAVASTAPVRLGVSTRFNVASQRVKDAPRVIRYYPLTNNGYVVSNMEYTAQITDASISATPGLGQAQVYAQLTSGVTRLGSNTAYNTVSNVLVFDTTMTTSSKRDVVMICGTTPMAAVFQEGINNPDGLAPRYFDLTSTASSLRSIGMDSTFYNIKDSVLLPGGVMFTVDKNSGGLFEWAIPYDIGVAFYNKPLDYESNVKNIKNFQEFKPADSENNFSLKISSTTFGQNMWYQYQTTSFVSLPFDFTDTSSKAGYPVGQGLSINDYSYRFYYRLAGIGEWLPLEEYDAAYLWFIEASEFPAASAVGKIPTARTTGGSPSQFQDYSPLPKLPYFQVISFSQRAFWFEGGSFRFSGSTHEFHYPTRNIIDSATGEWTGAMVFTRQNDVAAQSVLIVFSEQASYLCQFTGDFQTQVVRVSAKEVGEFTVDGSDFTIDILSDLTAFSHRSSVMAEGEAYWWGPQGITYFGGTGAPTVISLTLESDNEEDSIFNLCDPDTYKEVQGVYSPLTSEIIWFYTPATPDPDFPTHVLCFNTESRKFMRGRMPCQIDNAQNVDIGGSNYAPKSEGTRMVLYARETAVSGVQSPILFDRKNPQADMVPGNILAVSTVTEPTPGTRRLALATGSLALSAAGIVTGDYLLIAGVQKYAPALTGTGDFIAKITAVTLSPDSLDIILPEGAAMNAAFTATSATSFPVYHRGLETKGLHGIPWVVDTNFWLPNGLINAYVWQYIHFLFNYLGIPQPSDPFDPAYAKLARITFQNRTLVCDGPSTSELKLSNNSSDHCQIQHRVKNENRSANGQALAMRFSGIAFGDPWTLEYLEAQCILERGFTIKEFQQ